MSGPHIDAGAPPAPQPRDARLRLVLDTNVWLDWLVFGDAVLDSLKRAQAAGAVEIRIDEACGRELAAVLGYDLGKYTLDANARAACLAEHRRVACPRPGPLPPCGGGNKDNASAQALPKCRDADDQKFLELARDCGADYLVTKDNELLAMARRKSRPAPCRIVTPVELGAILGGQT